MKSVILTSLFAAGILAAQSPQPQAAPGAQPNPPMRSHHRVVGADGGQRVARLTRQLNLTPDQQNQAKSIFGDARTQARALAPKLREERQAMSAAIRSDNEAQIDQIARQDAQVNARAHAIRAKSMAKFYSILTPDQKSKFDSMRAGSIRVNARNHVRANSGANQKPGAEM